MFRRPRSELVEMENFILSKLSEINDDCRLGSDFSISDLDIGVNLETMKQLFIQTDGSLVMRPYRGETTLVIGCGNQVEGDYSGHSHKGCYTLDIEIFQKPSVLSNLEKSSLSFIPNGSLHLVMSEGGGPELSVKVMKELIRLLSTENGFIKWDLYNPIVGEYDETMICTSYNGIYHVMTGFSGERAQLKWVGGQLFMYHKPSSPPKYCVPLYCHEYYKPVSDEELAKLFACLNIKHPRVIAYQDQLAEEKLAQEKLAQDQSADDELAQDQSTQDQC